ncbi:hypothetical protein SODALDRAFT_329365 [Sodiomyces alkalinus F11]|uniref:Uncharacterized protein n=1 Tax=Sodiomyces alkalinus (strain CBS 110278 / VKM F-3762 / F11) TaxID=1314773 RepID=A0A3N2PKX4_SODAK|nr:hypothetical protein SODALDRAFT_329365 [Sodiomyces alkalinus F11]ROT35183.1 hypothetical protein SODALDRAFT_329365 [Sodiomyces alkalinus F11]
MGGNESQSTTFASFDISLHPFIMLLYTKVAAPKPPKRRSRAGCAYCKEKVHNHNEPQPHP